MHNRRGFILGADGTLAPGGDLVVGGRGPRTSLSSLESRLQSLRQLSGYRSDSPRAVGQLKVGTGRDRQSASCSAAYRGRSSRMLYGVLTVIRWDKDPALVEAQILRTAQRHGIGSRTAYLAGASPDKAASVIARLPSDGVIGRPVVVFPSGSADWTILGSGGIGGEVSGRYCEARYLQMLELAGYLESSPGVIPQKDQPDTLRVTTADRILEFKSAPGTRFLRALEYRSKGTSPAGAGHISTGWSGPHAIDLPGHGRTPRPPVQDVTHSRSGSAKSTRDSTGPSRDRRAWCGDGADG